MTDPVPPLRDVAIIGGGCYGSFYAKQLATARGRSGAEIERLFVVDRNPACAAAGSGYPVVVSEWDAFLEVFLDAEPPLPGLPDDAIVPSPLMPHLMATWLLGVVKRRWPGRSASLISPSRPLGTPYDALGPDGTRYVSFADWICPVHCIEPLRCPVIRAPRTWEMGDALRDYTGRMVAEGSAAGPALFTTRHYAFGVGLFGAAEIRKSRSVVEAAGAAGAVDVVVGTVSACHGAVSLLRVGPPLPGGGD